MDARSAPVGSMDRETAGINEHSRTSPKWKKRSGARFVRPIVEVISTVTQEGACTVSNK